jgi:hypothetical protein
MPLRLRQTLAQRVFRTGGSRIPDPRIVTDIESGSGDPRVPQGGPETNLSEGLEDCLESPALEALEGGIHFGQRDPGGDIESPALGEAVFL